MCEAVWQTQKKLFFNLLRADVKTEGSSSEPRHFFHTLKYCLDLSAFSLSGLH